jgi:hypothetical protein
MSGQQVLALEPADFVLIALLFVTFIHILRRLLAAAPAPPASAATKRD